MANLTIRETRKELSGLGITLRVTDDKEFRVNFQGGVEATAYYTPALDDALGTGRAMARAGQAPLMAESLADPVMMVPDDMSQAEHAESCLSHDNPDVQAILTWASDTDWLESSSSGDLASACRTLAQETVESYASYTGRVPAPALIDTLAKHYLAHCVIYGAKTDNGEW